MCLFLSDGNDRFLVELPPALDNEMVEDELEAVDELELDGFILSSMG